MTVENIETKPSGRDQRRPLRHWLLFFFRVILAVVFIFSAWAKMWAPYALRDNIIAFNMIPESWALTAAVFLIWCELVCGVFMLLGLWTRATTVIITCMLLAFEVGMISVVLRGIEMTCECFGSYFPMEVGWLAISKNFVLLIFTMMLMYFGSWKYSLDLVVKVNRRIKAGLPGWRK